MSSDTVFTIRGWINAAMRQGLICAEGIRRIEFCNGKQDYYRVISDVMGMEWICEMMDKGLILPLDMFKREYSDYVNGGMVMEYGESGYSTVLYVGHAGDATTNGTVMGVIDSDIRIKVGGAEWVRMMVSKNSNAEVEVARGGIVDLDVYKGGKYKVIGDNSHVRIKEVSV